MIRRLRTLTLWTGSLLSLLIAAAFVVSGWWYLWIGVAGGPFIGVHAGALNYHSERFAADFDWAGIMRHREGLQFALVGFTYSNGRVLPLVYPFLAVAIPTLLVWRFWPKPVKPGHCRCGYNLTGNASGVCPECGMRV